MDIEPAPSRRTHLLDVPVDGFTQEDLPAIVDKLRSNGERNHIVLLSTRDLLRARRKRRYRKALQEAALVVPISLGIQRSAKFLEKASVEAQTTFRFIIRLLALLEERSSTYYLLGLRRKHLLRVEENLRQTFPGLGLVGRHPGYYSQERETDIVTAIRKAAPTLVLVGSGINGGNIWLRTNKRSFAPGIYIWVPEVLEIFADVRKKPPATRAGRIARRTRVLLTHPWRVGRTFVYVWFGILTLGYRLFDR